MVPADAHVFQGEKDLGISPVLLEVEEGKTVTLTIRANGYEERELTLDGSTAKESIQLKKLPGPRPGYTPPRPKTAKAAPDPKPEVKPKKKPMGGGEIVNPWD